jgi:hypothetical protein
MTERLYQLTLNGHQAVLLTAMYPIVAEQLGVGIYKTLEERVAESGEMFSMLAACVARHNDDWRALGDMLGQLNTAVVVETDKDA